MVMFFKLKFAYFGLKIYTTKFIKIFCILKQQHNTCITNQHMFIKSLILEVFRCLIVRFSVHNTWT